MLDVDSACVGPGAYSKSLHFLLDLAVNLKLLLKKTFFFIKRKKKVYGLHINSLLVAPPHPTLLILNIIEIFKYISYMYINE